MPIRVNQETFYRQTMYSLFRSREAEYVLNNQYASGKRVNQPSDDPVASITAQYSHRGMEELNQYMDNLGYTQDWLKLSVSSMENMDDLLSQARTLAEQLSTSTYTTEQRQSFASQVGDIIDQLVQLGNSQSNGSYIFAGTLSNTAAVLTNPAIDNPAVVVDAQGGGGRLYGAGQYTGKYTRDLQLSVDAAYAGGSPTTLNPMQVNYSYVDDYGRTVSGSVNLTGTGSGNAVEVGDGLRIYTDEGSFAANGSYTLEVHRQQGNNQSIAANLASNSRMTFNYTLDSLWSTEGNSGSGWGNLLDQLRDWQDALAKDYEVQDYFEAVPGVANDRASSAQFQVSGEWAQLGSRDYEFYTGGPIQSSDADETLLRNYRNFTVDAAYTGGTPSAVNPMTVNYEYWDGAAWQTDAVVVTGTGSGNPVSLAGGYGSTIYLVDSTYTAGDSLPLETYPSLPAPPAALPSPLPEDTAVEPSATEPVRVTYTYVENGERRWGSVVFTGTGDDPANLLSLDPPGEATLSLNEGGTLNDGDTWSLTLEQYHQGQETSQALVATLESVQSNLLQYIGDAGGKLNRLEARTGFLENDVLRLNDRLKRVEDADTTEVSTLLATYQTMYQATLQATAMVSSTNLANYL